MAYDTKMYASYNSDLGNASSYINGSCDFAFAIQKGFSKRYRKHKLFLHIH